MRPRVGIQEHDDGTPSYHELGQFDLRVFAQIANILEVPDDVECALELEVADSYSTQHFSNRDLAKGS
jgi:hypothetical protein